MAFSEGSNSHVYETVQTTEGSRKYAKRILTRVLNINAVFTLEF